MLDMLTCFEETVSRFPEKKAIGFKEQSYTFQELRQKSVDLAQTMMENGVTGGAVAVMVDRDADVAVYLLAALYSGNYYIAVDPDMPIVKMKKIFDDSHPAAILAGEDREDLIEKLGYEGKVFNMSDAVAWDQPYVLPEMTGEEPIYMVYTSGSTGNPKGVLKKHSAVYDFITTFAKLFDLSDKEIIGNQTPFFFDASAKDFYLMILTGATLEVIPSEKFVLPVTLMEYINEKKVTYACWVPTAFAIVTQLNTFQAILPETLKKVFFVGEVFPIKQLRKWFQYLPDLTYVNLYGSTEISGISLYKILDPREELESIPMGQPMPNCHIWLENEKGVVTGTEDMGEVCIESKALASEYYHDPEKTAAVFRKTVAEDGSKKTVLHSGDLARYNEQGDLVFVSRKDFQIKHMGRRIELGEIESVADSLEEIQRCCCLYDQEKKKIKLYCSLTEGSTWDKKTIKHLLKERLSDYMVPGTITILEEMPINANGKINRTALKDMK